MYKNCNQTKLQIDENDEIIYYLHDRYIYSIQIVQKLFEYFTHEKCSTIYFLLEYLLDQQLMYFEIDLFVAKLQNRLNMSTFELLNYFEYNQNYENDRFHVYQNFSRKSCLKITRETISFTSSQKSHNRLYLFHVFIAK